MRIKILPYRKEWKEQFEQISRELHQILHELNPIIEHIGSTSIEYLSAKPIIDIQIGIEDKNQFNKVVELMELPKDYIYYEAFNEALPNRRLFVKFDTDSKLTTISSYAFYESGLETTESSKAYDDFEVAFGIFDTSSIFITIVLSEVWGVAFDSLKQIIG